MEASKNSQKIDLDADIAKFLAKGGEVKNEPIRVLSMKEMNEEGKRRFRGPINNHV